jgi:hypothetical protein
MRALEETRAKMTADLGAREAALIQREEAAAAAARKREDELRRRVVQDEQVLLSDHCPRPSFFVPNLVSKYPIFVPLFFYLPHGCSACSDLCYLFTELPKPEDLCRLGPSARASR